MTRYTRLREIDKGWTRWLAPKKRGFKAACCDCGLVHDMEFRVIEGVIFFRARRNKRATAAKRRWLKPK
jgi:hypothetical protein